MKTIHANPLSGPPADRLDWAVAQCRNLHVRLTPARERLLRTLAAQSRPMTIEMLAGIDGLRGYCDPATIYRTLMLLNELDVVRQISLPRKVSYFVLNAPGQHCDYLICRRCGAIAVLAEVETVRQLEQQVSAASGYTGVYHELEIYGICPACRKVAGHEIRSTKLPVRNS